MSIAILNFITQILRFVLFPLIFFSCASSSKLQFADALDNPGKNSVRNSRNQNTIKFDYYEKMLLGKWKLISEATFSTIDDECCDNRRNDDGELVLRNKTIDKTRKNVIWTFNSNMFIFIAQNGNITKETYSVHANQLTIDSKKYRIAVLAELHGETELRIVISNEAGSHIITGYIFQKIQ
jgi:hypothetical protein